MANKLYNLDYLNSISGGDQIFINDMVQTFINNSPGELDKISAFVSSGNWDKAGDAAHRFSSSLLFLGLDSLKVLSTEIEDLSHQGTNLGNIPGLIVLLKDGCNRVIEELKSDFNV